MTMNPRKILFAILVFAFVIRVAGIGYGLPLWLVADEPPFILGALKMIELKTVIPRFHLEEFRSVLYYPPYISYLLLPAFSGILAFKYLSFDGDQASFANYIGADLSDFFIATRFLNIIFALASIYLTYAIAKTIFKDEWTGLAGAFFASTSLLHILLSIAARQWMPVLLVFLLVLYFLIHPALSFKKRYLYSVLASGISMGISAISFVTLLLVGLHFLILEDKKISELLREKFVYFLAIIFIFLAALPIVIYPASIGFGGKISLFGEKSLIGFISSPFKFLSPLVFAEPILILMSAAGLFFAFFKNRKVFLLFVLFIISYAMIFYTFFRFEDRFLVPLLGIITILAGYGFSQVFSLQRLSIILLILPLIFSLKFGSLIFNNDSRSNLRSWIERNIPEGSKIIVRARLMRLASNADAISEKKLIAPESLRQVDRSELFFGKSPIYPSFHALNISDLENSQFYGNLEKYLKDNSYQFLVLGGEDSDFSVTDSKLGRNPFRLFETKELGPDVSLYNLPSGEAGLK